MTMLVCPRCDELSGPHTAFCRECGAALTLDAARRRPHGIAPRRSDLIGPERSEGPSFAPQALPRDVDEIGLICVHRGNIPAQSGISSLRGPSLAASPVADRPQGRGLGCGTLGLASDGTARRPHPFGSRARLRDALHGDDGSPGNGRVGA